MWARWFSAGVLVLLAVIALEGVLLVRAVSEVGRNVSNLDYTVSRSACGGADDACVVVAHRGGFDVKVTDAPGLPCGTGFAPCLIKGDVVVTNLR